MQAKYIVIDTEYMPMSMFIFPSHFDHCQFVRKLGFTNNDIFSAGFIKKQTPFSAMECFGYSTSLRKESKPDTDNKLLQRLLFDAD